MVAPVITTTIISFTQQALYLFMLTSLYGADLIDRNLHVVRVLSVINLRHRILEFENWTGA